MSIEDKRDHTRCLLTFLSYCLTGENHLKKILIMKGALGDNGKTCFLNLIKLVLGKFGFEPQKKVFKLICSALSFYKDLILARSFNISSCLWFSLSLFPSVSSVFSVSQSQSGQPRLLRPNRRRRHTLHQSRAATQQF